ncbi:MAG: SLC13 family permease [Gammaproteobacteria bacterium]
MSQLPWQAWATLAVVLGMFALLLLGTIATEAVLLAALTVLVLTGVVDAGTALGGFANGGLATVAVLYVVVAGLRDTGALGLLARGWLRQPSTIARARWRIMLPIAAASAVMNNTPLVAAALPVVIGWARRWRLPVSALLLPLSYAAILGGVCTLIGTSTNIIVAGLLETQARSGADVPTLGFFTLTPVGLVVAACGLAWVALAARRWLGTRDASLPDAGDPRTYFVELTVLAGGAIDGLTIEDAGLRHLPGGYLADVERDGELLAAVAPELRLRGDDRLAFVGDLESILDLRRKPGLAQGAAEAARTPRARTLVEAVVSDHSPLLGQSIRDAQFRTRYNAVVVGLARSGERVVRRFGDVVLQKGDLLLLDALPAFLEQQRHARDFYLVSGVPQSEPPRHTRAPLALVILVVFMAGASLAEQWSFLARFDIGIFHVALAAALAMIAGGCTSFENALKTVDWPVVLAIGASIGVGAAVDDSGLAAAAARVLGLLAGADNPWLALAGVYAATLLATELLSNNAAAVLMLPIALSIAGALEVSPLPFVIVLTVAASCGFATPLGYQTHLMVFGPGGYRTSDFLRVGLPLDVIAGVVTVFVTPWVAPFHP